MRRVLSILAASTAASTAGAFSVNLSLDPNRGRAIATAAAATRGSGRCVSVGDSVVGGIDVARVGGRTAQSLTQRAPVAPRRMPQHTSPFASAGSSTSSAGSFTCTSRRWIHSNSGDGGMRHLPRGGQSMMFRSNPALNRHSSSRHGNGKIGALAFSSSSSSSSCSSGLSDVAAGAGVGSGLLRRLSSSTEAGWGRRDKVVQGRSLRPGGRAAGERSGVVMEAYRYLNTYHDGISDEDREWNKFDEKDYVELGTSGLKVSRIGYGAMMVGGQMNEQQTHETLNHAFDVAGMNWLDTSESFPHPIMPEHAHKADPIIGSWLKGRDRSKVILCTKVAGRHEQMTWLRKDGTFPKLTRDHIMESVYGSLERMDTDYIDVLSFGDWPERQTQNPGNYFWKKSDEHETYLDFEEQLMIIQELKDQGLVRHVATAGDTPYGVTRYCEHAIWDDLPKIAYCTQEYNLFTQNKVEFDLVEACAPRQENVAIVATQTLGGGVFSGKYLFDRNEWDRKEGFRLNDFAGFQGRYNSPRMRSQLEVYQNIAAKYDLSVHQLATAFVHNKPFITAALVGATNKYQIDQNIAALDTVLPDECCRDIIAVQDADIEPMLGPSEANAKVTFFKDTVGREFGRADDETTRFRERAGKDYNGP